MSQLRENIRLLGDLLGKTIIQQAGEKVFDLEEKIRALAKAWRKGDESANSKIGEIVSEIATDLPLSSDIVKSFSTYFQLVNLTEEHERIRILNERSNEAHLKDEAMDESLLSAIQVLGREGFTADQVENILANMLVQPVFTAHPTESKRRTTRQILEQASMLLKQLRSGKTYEYQHSGIIESLHNKIALMWQSADSRKRRPTVMDEARNTGLYFFERTLLDVVPQIYRQLEMALQNVYPEHDWNVPAILKFGSWIGGDRDGNPFVTNETTELAIRAQKELLLKRYEKDVQSLYTVLSPAIGRATFNDDFLAQLEEDLKTVPESAHEMIERFHQEPYRQRLILIYRRLVATRDANAHDWSETGTNPRGFNSANELLHQLRSIEKSLCENKGAMLARGELSQLIRRVEVFGFHLASLDIRQHSNKHERALDEILKSYGIANYAELDEAQRVDLLSTETANKRPLTAVLKFSDECNETISLFRLVRQAHEKAGTESIQSYVISMTESVSDLMEVLLLMSDSDLFGALDIVPLFETIDDLNAAPEIMTKLFKNEVYKEHLALRGNQQQIMIGYSDSNKDGGFLRANWMLFQAQRRLAKTCSDHDIGLTLFHGRGGSIGRGGGPANRAILAQPNESIRGRIRITEQGEVVSSRYTHREIAERHLQQLIHAVICSSGRRPEFGNIETWSQTMDQLSTLGYQCYRQLVEQQPFIDYFQTATPIELIDSMNLGSRPSRRKKTQDISDLRAIPWVFAWTQSRTNIPSWFGVGSACKEWLSGDQSRLAQLQEMFRDWPFFHTTLANVHVGLGRADLAISEIYSQLADENYRDQIFAQIKNEFELTCEYVLKITGHKEILDTESWLQHSIRMRNPYVDPMNSIQVALLERYRNSNDDQERAELQGVILQTVNGIAAGLQNVG